MMSRSTLKLTLLAALLAASPMVAWSSSTLLDKPQYLGEIKRNERGELVAVSKPAETDSTSPATALPGKVHRVGPSRALRTIAAAAAIAQNGDTIEIEPGDYVADVAVWKQDRLTLRGVDGKPRLIAGGQSAEGKAIWVIRGGRVTVENIIFTGAKVPDRNGAGIRFEKGHLVVRNCTFLNNENGILTGAGDSVLEIENSEFGHNGAGDGQSHGIYVGAIKRLHVTGSYLHDSRVGHLLKSRAAENHILYNRLTDEIGGTASYELEFPNGGIAYVIGNIIQQSSTTENSTIISYGMEGYKWPTNELYLSYNTIVDDRPQGGIFLNVKPGAQKVMGSNNLLVGKGGLNVHGTRGIKERAIQAAKRLLTDSPAPAQTGTVFLENNITTEWSSFAQASRFDYRVRNSALSGVKVTNASLVNGLSLAAQREYMHPASSKGLIAPPMVPGAVQTRAPSMP